MTTSSSATPQRSAALPWLGYLGGLVLGAVLLVAAWAKLLDPEGFADQIRRQGLDFLLPASAVAMVALALEIGLGVALVLGLRRRWVLVAAALLVAFFLFLTGRDWWREAHGLLPADAGCGCFGNLVDRTPKEAFWQDLGLLVPGLLLAFLGRPRGPLPRWRAVATLALTVAGLAFAWQAPHLPLDDWATRLKPGSRLDHLCAGGEHDRVCLDYVLAGAEKGDHLVVLANLDDPAFAAAVPKLNDLFSRSEGPALIAIAATTPEVLQRFYWSVGNLFEIREAPLGLVKPLARRLPRSFLVRDGVVVETYSGLPPLPAAAR
ncbi:MAG TPA: DoxX family membrane protein [Thermoanaerobaculia bacterium]|nr:DoxX family membrane protein [Thermoanaerobaculia bacterium]